ncbi:MAG TPA: DUF4266 domain-containing protein [Solimonas sp.]
MKQIPSSVMCVLGLLLIATTSACSLQTVKPWQRGDLASQEMDWETDPLLAVYRRHVEFSKEAASGGPVLAGGGCGCN